jgi:hypothetical protein
MPDATLRKFESPHQKKLPLDKNEQMFYDNCMRLRLDRSVLAQIAPAPAPGDLLLSQELFLFVLPSNLLPVAYRRSYLFPIVPPIKFAKNRQKPCKK